jgi:titin
LLYQDGVEIAQVTSTSWTQTGLKNGQSYEFAVAALNSAGLGERSSITAMPRAPVTVPQAPTGLVAVPGDAKVTISWMAPSSNGGAGIDHYVIYQNGGEVGQATGTHFEVVGLSNGLNYRFTVAAHNVVGTGPMSEAVQAIPLKPTTVPSTPLSLTATPGDSRVQLSWAPPADYGGSALLGYKLYWSQEPGGPYVLITMTATSYLHLGLEDERTYYYKVAAVNSVGEGATTEIVTVRTANATTLPSAPTDLVAVASSGAIELRWTAPADGGSPITQYFVYRGTDPDTLVLLATVTETSYLDDRANPGDHYYRVVAVNALGAGPLSELVSVTVQNAPTAPSILPLGAIAIAATGIYVAALVIGKLIMKKRVRR